MLMAGHPAARRRAACARASHRWTEDRPRPSRRTRRPARASRCSPSPRPPCAAGRSPVPSSLTSTSTPPASKRSVTAARAFGPACLSEFVSASCTRRKTVSWAPGRECRGVALDCERHRETGRAHLTDELVELVEARLGPARALAPVVAQHAEEAAHLGERLATGCRHVLHRLDRLPGRPLRGEGRAVGQGDHHAQVVGDDVVHLAGDAGALGGGGPLFGGGLDGAALTNARADPRRGDREAGEADERLEGVVGAPARRGQHGAGSHHAGRDHGALPRLARGDREQRNQERGISEHLHVGEPLHAGDRGDHGEDGHRPASPPHERERECGVENHQFERAVLLGERVDGGDREDAESERGVGDRLVAPREGDQALCDRGAHVRINLRARRGTHNGREADLCATLTYA